MPEGSAAASAAQELPTTAKDVSKKKEKLQLNANMKPPQRLDQMEEGTDLQNEQVQLPEANAEFIEEVRNFLLSTNQYISKEQMEDLLEISKHFSGEDAVRFL